ncbi:SGNH hydrolase domain-containing protein [Solirubrobacter soli]|uniref:SGNH hydrolase domain-containing protein n=1 Tax=Solirubrobacter soli TaxID=363832 RepID=UPI000483CBED|nr:SGNH hydrolase domain-containing protein [Solirubrobacter soli]
MRLVLALVGLLLLAGPAHAAPRCFGAASRDPEHRCVNPKLAKLVTPTPDQALLNPNFACVRHAVTERFAPCEFGSKAPAATVALIGDSHAQHWRSALAVVAKRHNWRVEDASVPLCMFSTATTSAEAPFDTFCPAWNQDVVDWLAANPQISTIFVAGKTRQYVEPAPGQSSYAARVEGYKARFAALADRTLIVIRDDPDERVTTKDCVRRRMARRQTLVRACGVPRRTAVTADPAIAAARAVGARTIDLTDQFCGPSRCYPVIGGALVHKDADHLTQVFSRTLGPFLDRAYRDLTISSTPAPTVTSVDVTAGSE